MDVATRAPALGFRTDPSRERATAGVDEPSLSFSEKERAYYAETFGRGSEPPREPSALALAAFANVPNALERTARPEATSNAIPGDAEARGPRRADASSVSATDLKRRSNDDVKRNDDGNDAERVSASREPLRRVTSSATDVSEPSETREVFVDLEDTPDRLADRPADASAAEKLLVAASENCARWRTRTDSSWTRRGRSPSGTYERRHPRPRLNTRTIRPPVSRYNATIRSMPRERSFSRRSPPRRLTRTIPTRRISGWRRPSTRTASRRRRSRTWTPPLARRRRRRTFPPSRTRKPTGRTSRTRTGSWTRPVGR